MKDPKWSRCTARLTPTVAEPDVAVALFLSDEYCSIQQVENTIALGRVILDLVVERNYNNSCTVITPNLISLYEILCDGSCLTTELDADAVPALPASSGGRPVLSHRISYREIRFGVITVQELL